MNCSSLPLLPAEHPKARGKSFRWGTFIKLYEYRLPNPSAVYFDLAYELSRKLYTVAIPFRLLERRDYVSKEYDRTLSGMDVRLAENPDQIEDGFPLDDEVEVPGIGRLKIKYVLFKDAKKERWITASEAIFFTVNGQTHAVLPRNFYTRLSVRLDFLARDLMTLVARDGLNREVQENLFMPSRDRLRVGEDKQALEAALAERLHHHPGLREWNHRRQEEASKSRLSDPTAAINLFERLVQQSPEIARLLSLGFEVKGPVKGPQPKAKFVGLKFPTRFDLVGRQPLVKECPINSHCFVKFDTDAENDYFGRADSPGGLAVSPRELFLNRSLWEGTATLSLKAPPGARVGDTFAVTIEVTDDSRVSPFRSELTLKLGPPANPQPNKPGKPRPHSGRLAVPEIREVKQEQWDEHDFDDLSAVEIKGLTEPNGLETDTCRFLVYVNIDNRFLKNQILQKRANANDMKVMTEQFKLGTAVVGIAARNMFREREERDQFVDDVTKAAAQVLVPLIRTLPHMNMELAPVAEDE